MTNVEPRRYGDLKNIARSLLTSHSVMSGTEMATENFEYFWAQLWTYGCHCFSGTFMCFLSEYLNQRKNQKKDEKVPLIFKNKVNISKIPQNPEKPCLKRIFKTFNRGQE